MAKKSTTPPVEPTVIRRKKADEPPPVTVEPVVEEQEETAEMTEALAAITAVVPVEVRNEIRGLVANRRALSAIRKLQAATDDAGAPALSRPEQRACIARIVSEAPVSSSYVAPDNSDGEDDSFQPPPPPPAPPKRAGKAILGKRSVDREMPLNDIEFCSAALALAQCEQESRAIALRHKDTRARMKQESDDANANRARLAEMVAKRVEVRSCTLLIEADYDMGCVREIDIGTQDVIETRPMRPEEMQVPLIPQAMLTEAAPEPELEPATTTDGPRLFEVLDGGAEDGENSEPPDDGSEE